MVKSDTQPQENVQGPSESDPKSEKQAKVGCCFAVTNKTIVCSNDERGVEKTER